jgi:RHS repeat-associated protein
MKWKQDMKTKKKSGLRSVPGSGVLNTRVGRNLKRTVQRLAVGCCTLFILSRPYSGQSEVTQRPPATGESAPSGLVPVNRTVPQVEPPKTALEFSASPTPMELFRARVFEEPLVPVGGEPSPAENAALAAALLGYSNRSGPDDFSSLTGFLETHPQSPWAAALLTDLGLEYYNTAHYSLALEAWGKAWPLGKGARDARGVAVADRAVGELAYMYARLGRMTELDALLKSVQGRTFTGPATEKINGAREGLWTMQNRPEVAFRCGPLALQRIKLSLNPQDPGDMEKIFNSVSTQKGFSLSQVVELAKKIGLDYQMAFREADGSFVVPSVVHWKVGHYAAMVRREGDRYLLQDPTFGNEVWATKQALEVETSGYFLVPPGAMPHGWREVSAKEVGSVWGKGVTSGNDDTETAPHDLNTGNSCKLDDDSSPNSSPLTPMAVSSVHLMMVNLNLRDEPVRYSPPVGPAVRFAVRYNHRDAFQPANFTYSNFGSKWTSDWISYITDNPQNLLADVNYYIRGGGVRAFTGFNTNSQAYVFQQFDQTLLTRTGPTSYEMLSRDGSKLVFSQSDGSSGTSRKLFLTQVLDPFGNAVTLTYDVNLRLVAITDAIGQVTTLSYANASDIYKITRVTDPFGRFAMFNYDSLNRLSTITDVIGLTSQFNYDTSTDFINALVTPYGTTTFTKGGNGNTRSLETLYPDGSRERVEYNQSGSVGTPNSDPVASVPAGMSTYNATLFGRDTYYWSGTATALAYGDYSKAKIYHWLHMPNLVTTSGVLESSKEALEGRVWYDYAGQPAPYMVGSNSLPNHVGRVLDDGTTQIFSTLYDGFGHPVKVTDPAGRTRSYIFSTNGIDLLEIRQTRAGNNELLSKSTYNSQHLVLTKTDAAGQTTTYTYDPRGLVLTVTNAKGEVVTKTYDTNGYLIAVDGPLPGTNDIVRATYDAYGRTRTSTDVSGYMLTFDYDALDRITQITHPDGTFEQSTYNRLDLSGIQDRAGRQTLLAFDSMRQLAKRTDPLNRVTQFEWCSCGSIKSLTDPLGRTTTWEKDVQGRLANKIYGDGSRVSYDYENTTSRLHRVTDEKSQSQLFTYYFDNTLRSVSYASAGVPTPRVTFTYDPDYQRIISMSDGTGLTSYQYNPITSLPVLGAGRLAAETGPLPNDTITYSYDPLGRRVQTAINGVPDTRVFDAGGRIMGETNALGSFSYAYDGPSARLVSESCPNGLTTSRGYGDSFHDFTLQRITHLAGATPVSEFLYGQDIADARITTWSQQTGAQTPPLYTLGYDAENQILSATVTNAGAQVAAWSYSYDQAGNRLMEQAGATSNNFTVNALNQISIITGGNGLTRTNEWDARERLTAVTSGNERTEFTYDGLDRLASIRKLVNGIQVSLRRFLWHDSVLCEERDAGGNVTKRYFPQGMQIVTGPAAGNYFYTRDHLDSVRELIDASGAVRARYAYDPFGRRTKVAGDLDADFGFAGMFWTSEASLSVTRFRPYDPQLGRWLSRDPLKDAESVEGWNLYAYVRNNPANQVDPLGLCCEKQSSNLSHAIEKADQACSDIYAVYAAKCNLALQSDPYNYVEICAAEQQVANAECDADFNRIVTDAHAAYKRCAAAPCKVPACEPFPRISAPFAYPLGIPGSQPFPSQKGPSQ